MSEKQDINIRIFKLYDMWRYEIKFGKSTYLGSGKNFDDAEHAALDKAKSIKDAGVVHMFYEGGKSVEQPKETFQDDLINEGFKKA